MNEITMKMQADQLIRMALQEDITSEDVSTNSVMPHPQQGEVDLICKEDGIICGLQVFERTFTLLDSNTTVEFFVKDGDHVKAGELMGKVHGDIRVLLCGERTALNYLQRMSGIATYTSQVAKLLEGTGIKLLDTRKTTPNNRIFEKYAVKTGGGNNHRLNALEYHRNSEINIAVTNMVLLLGWLPDVTDAVTYDTSRVEAFFVPAGTVVEMYGTTLHYAPCNDGEEGFKCIVILPKGTNTEIDFALPKSGEDALMTAKNKWLIAHEEAGIRGAFNGLLGVNIEV